jgi:hypothetical protein
MQAGVAWLADKAIIPACFGDLLKDAMPKPYSNIQALSLDDDDGPHYLLTSIHYHLKSPIPPPPFPPNDSGVSALRDVLAEAARRLPEQLQENFDHTLSGSLQKCYNAYNSYAAEGEVL